MSLRGMLGYDVESEESLEVMRPNEVRRLLGEIMNPEVIVENEKFLDDYEMFLDAYDLVCRKHAFYFRTIERDRDIILVHGQEIGDEDFTSRILHAIIGCRSKSDELAAKMNEMLCAFPAKCLQARITRLERLKLSEKQESEFMRRAILCEAPEIHPPFSNCERTGICTCIGAEEPYMRSCVDDSTTLMRGKKAAKKRLDDVTEKAARALKR